MGSCLSKKGSSSSSQTTDTGPGRTGLSASSNPKDIAVDTNQGHRKVIPVVQHMKEEEAAPQEEASGFAKKKEVFIIKHRKSHDRAPPESDKVLAAEPEGSSTTNIVDVTVSNNGSGHVRAVSIGTSPIPEVKAMTKEDEVDAILLQCGRLSHSNSRNSGGRKYSGSKRSYDFDHPNSVDAVPADTPSSDFTGDDERQLRRSQGSRSRRRTPSREREQQRSGSRERIPGSRRVSRSPARRSETNPNPTASTESNKPGKIVSVPATVSSMAANTGEATAGTQTVRRVTVKRNVNVNSEIAPRTAVPSPRPRSQSPARRQAQQQLQPTSLSRSSSRKAEQSPLRRNPLSDIDTNKLATCKSTTIKEKPKNEIDEVGAAEKQTPRKLTRSRSSRRTYDNLEFNPLEINPAETTNPTSSYTALLLEDIQNFHQKNTTPAPTTPPFTLPPCVTKAHSIYQAVADLNSSISHEDKTSQASSYQYSTNRFEFKSSSKDPFVESAVVADDDLLEPSFHKYVTVKRGSVEGDRDQIESSGSNSFMGGGTPIQQKNWELPSEPGSVDSSDCWTSRSNTTSDLGNDGSRIRKMNAKNREQQHPSAGVGRGRVQCR